MQPRSRFRSHNGDGKPDLTAAHIFRASITERNPCPSFYGRLCCDVVSQVFKFSLQAKINEYFGIFLLYRQQIMAGGTIVGDRLAVRAGV